MKRKRSSNRSQWNVIQYISLSNSRRVYNRANAAAVYVIKSQGGILIHGAARSLSVQSAVSALSDAVNDHDVKLSIAPTTSSSTAAAATAAVTSGRPQPQPSPSIVVCRHLMLWSPEQRRLYRARQKSNPPQEKFDISLEF